uniref:Polycystin 1, transient receptor potential channel interacting n=1 Tax=Cyprinodon variegatus TaxID=28743 RepID=A0A3Q2C8H1_CYPVA
MPGGNGQTLSKREDGVWVPKFSFFPSLLVALCCLEVWGSGPQGAGGGGSCSPCPVNCSCAPAGPQRLCVVNCSNIGLERAPAAADLPPTVNSLIIGLLSFFSFLRNLHITDLVKMTIDLSDNQITTIEERICDNLCNLTQIDLSNNPFECDCKLFRLVRWLQEKGVQVRPPDAKLCNLSLETCLSYAACLEDSSSRGGGGSELVIFTYSKPGNYTREQCNSVCFGLSHLYGGLGERHECLCSTNNEPNFISGSHYSAACNDRQVMKKCGWTLARDVFAVEFSVSVRPLPLQSVHNLIVFSATSSVTPVTLFWDFGDQTPQVNTTGMGVTTAAHKFAIPGRYKVSLKAVVARTDVTVALPPKLELHCPSSVVANKSLEVTLVSWGGINLDVNWTISKNDVQVATALPDCPQGEGVLDRKSSTCFHIFPEELSWKDARQQCLRRNGDLAVVRSDELRNLLARKVTQERGIWLGLSDVNSPGKLRWVNGSAAQEGEEGQQPHSSISPGNVCVSFDQNGQTSSHLCDSKRAYVCQYNPQVRVPDAGVYMLGMTVFSSQSPMHPLSSTLLTVPQPPSHAIEMLLFPAMSFVQAGRLSSLEFVTRNLSSQVHIRFQTYRPKCPGQHLLLPSCGGPACSPVAVCVPSHTLTKDPPSCPPAEQWCPFKGRCLALSDPCHSTSCTNCTPGHNLPPGASRPKYTLTNEIVFSLPAGPGHVLDIMVFPGDVIALQHDSGPSSLLQCQSSPQSLWRQPVLALNLSEWFWMNSTRELVDFSDLNVENFVKNGKGGWLEEETCLIRVLYVGQNETRLQGAQLSVGLPQPGLYSLLVSSTEPSYPSSASCPLQIVPPLGLTILHPPNNGTLYMQPNNTRLVLRVHSQYETRVSRLGTNHSVTFQSECPTELFSSQTVCQPGWSPGSEVKVSQHFMYAVLDLSLKREEKSGPVKVELEAHNNVTESSLTVVVHLEEPLEGLVVKPDPEHRVLMDSVVSYTASVVKGSNPTFKWTVDDKPYFTYFNSVLNVIYQNAAIYKLTVTATNHVSTLVKHFNITVDRLQPMANLTVKGVPDVVPQGSNQTLTTSVVVDMSVPATFRWSFGDGGYEEFESKPPYSPSLLCPASPNQILLSKNITYIYSQPGIYTALVSVSNRYENISQSINMSVYSILTRVDIQTEPQFLLATKLAEFEAHPLPSPYGIHYDWNFGDGSALQQGRRVEHTFSESGVFNVCVSVNNTISFTSACAEIFVYEEIEDLTAQSSSPTELQSRTTVRAHLGSGNNITWTFSMGDGTIYTTSEPQMSHSYIKEGNYTVNVTAKNAVSSGWTILPVHVYVLQVIRMEPAGCVQERTKVVFHAQVSGNATIHYYQWSFGDGSPNETFQGNPMVSHTYQSSGNYHLSLLLSSGVNKATKANFFNWVCVQPALTNISFIPDKSHYTVGEEIYFRVTAEPEFNYSYRWDFGREESPFLIHGSGNVVTKYKKPGHYLVTVYVFNNISANNASAVIDILAPVGPILIHHNGTNYNNLSRGAPYAFTTSSLASDVIYTWSFGDGSVLRGKRVLHSYNISGKYNIRLQADNSVSHNETALQIIVLAPILRLRVNSSLVNVPLNDSVHFEAYKEEGDGVRYFWILCDRCTSILGNHTMFYTFRSIGTFNIIVIAENDVGTAQASISLFVQRRLEGLQILKEKEGRTAALESCCHETNSGLRLQAGLKEGTNMTFSWSIVTELDPDSSFNASGKTVELNIPKPGPCDISLRAENLLGHLVVNKTINFFEPPADVFLKISNNPVATGASTNLTVEITKGSDLQYQWSVDGRNLQWTKPSLTYTFNSPGLKQVSVTVFNDLSSANVTNTIHVQDMISGLSFSGPNEEDQLYVKTGANVSFEGKVKMGTDVRWTWLVEGKTKSGKKIFVDFTEPKTATVTLNATNNISSESISRKFIVQDAIKALELKVSKKLVAVNENVVFTPYVIGATDVNLTLSIDNGKTIYLQANKNFTQNFSRAGTYMMNLMGCNKIDCKKTNVQIVVMEPVSELSIQGIQPAIPVGETRIYTADIKKGEPVDFLWTFDMPHLKVSYTPEQPGTLIIYLGAFNSINCRNITERIQVQTKINSTNLYAMPQDTFINKTITFMVSITPKSSPVNCTWDFGDGFVKANNNTDPVHYKYSNAQHYQVQVNCSNQVSSDWDKVEVNIRELDCEEPDVQISQSRLVLWRSQPISAEAIVDLKGCFHYRAHYLWQVFPESSCEDLMRERESPLPPNLRSQIPTSEAVRLPVEVDVQRLQLLLPKRALAAGNYCLVFSLAYEGVPLRKDAYLELSIVAAKLKPIIEGGSHRVWPRTQDLQLSAEQSYDPNMDPDNQSPLYYLWECETTSKFADHCATLNLSFGLSDPVLEISGSELEADVEYTFKLTISKEGMPPESTTQTVLVQSGSIPMVSLECVSCTAHSIYEVSQNFRFLLKGTCNNCKGFHRGRWSAMTLHNETLVLDSSSTTTGSDGMYLVLRKGVLRDKVSYIFTLHVTDSSLDGEGAASYILHQNMPPEGGECHLTAAGEAGILSGVGDDWRIRTLLDQVHFNCSGYSDLGVSETPFLYSLLVTRCREDYCEDFCIYKGSNPEHSAFLPPGFRSARHRVSVSITVEDYEGAACLALNKTIEVVLPDLPPEYSSLPHWLSEITDSKLKKLLEQGDSQRVRELSLALITVLNEYEQTRESSRVSRDERDYRVRVRSNITRALTALDLNTFSDIQQTSAALAQCTAVSREFICEECQNSTLNKLESMLEILQTDTKQGMVPPTEIADNILNIMGDLIHQVSQSASHYTYVDSPSPSSSSSLPDEHGNLLIEAPHFPPEPHPLHVAAKAYSLSSVLMLILMHARVPNEEPLILRGAEIAATGKLADPQSLLCYHGNSSPECQQFSIPRAFNQSLGRAAVGNSILQLLFQVESNPFPFNYISNYAVSTEVASMEFRTENGTHIPISGLDDSMAITVAINNSSCSGEAGAEGPGTAGLPLAGAVNVSRCNSVVVRVSAGNSNRQAGLFVQLNFTSIEDKTVKEEPFLNAYLHSHEQPNEFNCTDRKRITLSMTRGQDHRKYTFFLSPESYDTTQDYFINVSMPCSPDSQPASVRLEVGVFATLCQYFSEAEKQWRTDGMVPLAETNFSRAVCRTRHLTSFAAGLFVPSNAVSFKMPEQSGAPSLIVLLVCILGLLSYIVAAAILHKLDQLDLRQAGVVPLCGQNGCFKYEIQVKTGWSRGAGTTAHVGISLYGRESRSGHRHLDSKGAFTRNALNIFHIATDTSLGSVWKIRVWHDNKGLSPAWMPQYVLVKDLQTESSYYFPVEEWLSVDNERTGGRVEIEVEAAEEAVLLRFPRLLRAELQRALCESHLWLSLWERPPRSPFTRLQRATCCAVLLQLILLANTLWYSIIVDTRYSKRVVSLYTSLNAETLAAGVVACLIVYPLYLLVFAVFRMSRSKSVTVEQVSSQGDQESVVIDDFLDNSLGGSSILFFNGEVNSEETNVDLPSLSLKSDDTWDMPEEDTDDRDWPDGMNDEAVVGGAGHGAGMPRLKRVKGSRYLGEDMTLNPEEEGSDPCNKNFNSSDEDLIKHILEDGQNFFPQADESEMADLSSIFGDKTEVILLQKLSEPLTLESIRRDPPKTAFMSNTVITDVCRPRRFPPWCGLAAMWGSWAGIALASCVSIWAGYGFSEKVAMMWLISCFASFLCSCLLLEPIKVLCEAVYFAVCVRRLRPEDSDVLVDYPREERVVQRVTRVRPPQGFALSQARHQARKVHMLHTMLKNFLVYMFFLLVVLLLNYSDSAKDTHSLRLRTQLQRALLTPERKDVLVWLNDSLLPRLLDESSLLRDTGSMLVGCLRLQQTRDTQHFLLCHTHSPSFFLLSFFFFSRAQMEESDRNMVHHFNGSLKEASSSLQQQLQMTNHKTRAMFVEFSLYNINTNLLAVCRFLFEFPVSERAQSSLDLIVITLWPISGLDLQLLLTMVLLCLILYFLVRGILGFLKEGYRYLLSSWRVMGICKLCLAASVCGLHLSRSVMAKQQWTLFLKQPNNAFIDFYPLARRSQLYTVMSAMLLFILVLKASHQLRFLREWAVFGRALRRSAWELLGVALALLLLVLAYSHTGHLLFHSVLDGYGSVSSACLSLLGAGGRGLVSWLPALAMTGPSNSVSTLTFHATFALLRLVFLWLIISVLLRNYRRARAELYRPAVDLQDYEMVELFVRRLKMWMGLSRTKEFRHKVRFEGMELPPSRSSSTSDCKSLCLPPLDSPDSPPTPDSVDAGSEASWRPASSSPCSLTEAPGISLGLGLGLSLGLSPGVVVGGMSWRERAETEASLRRLLPTLDALLQQLDRVNMATEDVYHMECRLERAQRKRRLIKRERGEDGGEGRGGGKQRGKGRDKEVKERRAGKEKHTRSRKEKKTDKSQPSKESASRKTPAATPVPFSKPKAPSASTQPPTSHSSVRTSVSASSPSSVTDKPIVDPIPASSPPLNDPPSKAPLAPSYPRAQTPSMPPTCGPTPIMNRDPPTDRETLPSSSLFNHPAHTTTIPTRKRKRKAPPLKNKVHPT